MTIATGKVGDKAFAFPREMRGINRQMAACYDSPRNLDLCMFLFTANAKTR